MPLNIFSHASHSTDTVDVSLDNSSISRLDSGAITLAVAGVCGDVGSDDRRVDVSFSSMGGGLSESSTKIASNSTGSATSDGSSQSLTQTLPFAQPPRSLSKAAALLAPEAPCVRL